MNEEQQQGDANNLNDPAPPQAQHEHTQQGGAADGAQQQGEQQNGETHETIGGKSAGGALEGDDQAGESREEPFRLELGAKVYLFERAVDDQSNVLDGYQKPKLGKVVKYTDEDHHIDVETGGEDEPRLVSHDVAYRTERAEGANFWSETDQE